MNESLRSLGEAHKAMVERARHHYNPQFAELWRVVAREVRKQTAGKGSFPQPVCQVLNDHQSAFAKLQRTTSKLYVVEDRFSGLMLVDHLRIEHDDVEESLFCALCEASDLSDEQQCRLSEDAERRQRWQDRLRREVRLIVDQGSFYLEDALAKAAAGDIETLETMAGHGMDYMSSVLPSSSLLQG